MYPQNVIQQEILNILQMKSFVIIQTYSFAQLLIFLKLTNYLQIPFRLCPALSDENSATA